jgi:hypothetical protein
VYRFEGLKPLSVLLPRLQPPAPPPGLQVLLLGGREGAAAAARAARRKLLRTFAARLLGALSFSHARGVAHCCLGPGSVQCSGLDDREPDRVIVKLDNWGLARLYPGPLEAPPESAPGACVLGGRWAQRLRLQGRGTARPALPLTAQPAPLNLPGGPPPPPSPLDDANSDAAQQRRADLQAAGLLLTEAFVAGTAGGAAAAALGGGEALRRLLFEVFHEDIMEFRAYCEADVGAAGIEGRRAGAARAAPRFSSATAAPRRAPAPAPTRPPITSASPTTPYPHAPLHPQRRTSCSLSSLATPRTRGRCSRRSCGGTRRRAICSRAARSSRRPPTRRREEVVGRACKRAFLFARAACRAKARPRKRGRPVRGRTARAARPASRCRARRPRARPRGGPVRPRALPSAGATPPGRQNAPGEPVAEFQGWLLTRSPPLAAAPLAPHPIPTAGASDET